MVELDPREVERAADLPILKFVQTYMDGVDIKQRVHPDVVKRLSMAFAAANRGLSAADLEAARARFFEWVYYVVGAARGLKLVAEGVLGPVMAGGAFPVTFAVNGLVKDPEEAAGYVRVYHVPPEAGRPDPR
jgi:hypothetical protein